MQTITASLKTNKTKMRKPFYQLAMIACLLIVCGCNSINHKTDIEANREIVRKYHEIWSDGQVANLYKIIAPDFFCHFI